VSTQVTVVWSVCISISIRGSTGTVIDCINANDAVATDTTMNVTQ